MEDYGLNEIVKLIKQRDDISIPYTNYTLKNKK